MNDKQPRSNKIGAGKSTIRRPSNPQRVGDCSAGRAAPISSRSNWNWLAEDQGEVEKLIEMDAGIRDYPWTRCLHARNLVQIAPGAVPLANPPIPPRARLTEEGRIRSARSRALGEISSATQRTQDQTWRRQELKQARPGLLFHCPRQLLRIRNHVQQLLEKRTPAGYDSEIPGRISSQQNVSTRQTGELPASRKGDWNLGERTTTGRHLR